MRFIFSLFFFSTSLLLAQISNVRQTAEKNRIIITYDLSGNNDDSYNIKVTATNNDGQIISPRAVVGDLADVFPGKDKNIWWQTSLDGLTSTGWKMSLTAKKDIGINWVFVQGGPTGDFYISATEVTFQQYDMFCEATGYNKPSSNFGRGKQPVINVNVADAQAFSKWLSEETGTTIRLPEENEWEFAANGGNKSNGYTYSGSNSVGDVAWYTDNSGSKTHEVATKRANELGIYDMSGNVWEWCGTNGVLRGGSFSNSAVNCRVAYRVSSYPDVRDDYIGFRCARTKN